MKPRIKIYTRSFDLRLYTLSKALYEGWTFDGEAIPCVRLTDKSADGYFYSMLRDTDCDIAVNVDEDAFITDPGAVLDLVRKVIDEGWANAGASDGDPATTGRDKIVTNPFFNVFNLSLIRQKFDRSVLHRSLDDAEPYYPFFKWMASEFKTLYLPCRRHSDGITTVLLDGEGRTLCLHTWFSRFYSMPSWIVRKIEPSQGMQKERIDRIIESAYSSRGMEMPAFTGIDRLSFAADKTLRWAVKTPQRISRWPYKLKRKILRKMRG